MIATPLFSDFTSGLLGFAMLIVSLFLILLILVQRGRGGGLTGALGGPGGQSAFGTKAGDLFTRITSFVALGWITLCAFTMWLLGPDTATQAVAPPPSVTAAPSSTPSSTDDLIDLSGSTPAAQDTVPADGVPAEKAAESADKDAESAGDDSPSLEPPAAPESPAAASESKSE
jgi:preprotein translocase subunit SecG